MLIRAKQHWQFRGALRADRELCDLLEFRLQSLGAEELEAVEVLAAAEVLSGQILRELCDVDAVARLERRGIVQVIADESGTVARLANPVMGEAALQHAGVARTRQINSMLKQHLWKQMRTQEQR